MKMLNNTARTSWLPNDRARLCAVVWHRLRQFGRATLPRSRKVDACTYFNGSAGASPSQKTKPSTIVLGHLLLLIAFTVLICLPVESIADDDVSVDAPVLVRAARRIWDHEDEVEQSVFPFNMSPDKIRTQLEEKLDQKISSINMHCKLSDEQRQKLRLAGIRDINRLFDRVEALKKSKEFTAPANEGDFEFIDEKSLFWKETARLQRVFWSNDFVSGRDALFTKTLQRVLIDEQRAANDVISLLRKPILNVQPNRISFGTVRVGVIAEANIRIIEQGLGEYNADSDVEIAEESPAFLKDVRWPIEDSSGNTCTVSISLSTAQPGEFAHTLTVLFGDDLFAEIPISATVLAHEPGLRRLLVVETPFHGYSTDDGSRFEAWRDIVKSEKIDVSYLEVHRRKSVLRDLDLSRFDVILLAESGVFNATPDDFERLATFVESGGRAVIAVSAHYDGSVAKANTFISRFGMTVENAEVNRERTIEIDSSEIASHEFTRNVHALKFFRPSAVSTMGSSQGLILVGAPSIPNSGFVATAKAGKGSVVALGTSLWWKWIASDREKCEGNAMLLRNLICQP